METVNKKRRRQLAVVTDGLAGNEAQALALAEAISRRVPVALQTCSPQLSRWAETIPPGILHSIGIARYGADPKALPKSAELIIGAGRRVAPLVAQLGKEKGVHAVQLMNPRMPFSAFEAVIAPQHDQVSGENVLETVGALTRLTPTKIADAARSWQSRLRIRRPRVAVMVGGSSKSSGFGPSDAELLIRALRALSESHGLMITTSRRTPQALCDELTKQFSSGHLVWTGGGDNPYPAILGLADYALVTADSVNMASEAASTGKPVFIFPIPGLAPKMKRFHAGLAATGASRPYDGVIEPWTYTALAEADRAAGWLLGRLGWKHR
ncbi:MAG: mitochondrial fission ELM1 family protein [Pseudomonadota bacterium]